MTKEEKPKRKMKPGGGKAKGNSFELTIAKKLSVAFPPLKFIRTPNSGARVGGINYETIGKLFGEDALKVFVGDVVPVNEKESQVVWKHSLECKFYKTPDVFTSLVSGTANIFKWMQESVVDAAKINKNPLLIFKWNNTPIFVGIRGNDLDTILVNSDCKDLKPSLIISNDTCNICIFYFEDLLKNSSFWYHTIV